LRLSGNGQKSGVLLGAFLACRVSNCSEWLHNEKNPQKSIQRIGNKESCWAYCPQCLCVDYAFSVQYNFVVSVRSSLLRLKSKKQQTNLKTISGSSPIFGLSNHTTDSYTQTGATVPLSKWSGTSTVALYNVSFRAVSAKPLYLEVYCKRAIFKRK
jgi:hypothetical protein